MGVDLRRRTSSLLARTVIISIALTGAAQAAREPSPPDAVGSVTVTLGRCPGRWEREMRRALEVEIGDRLAAAGNDARRAANRLVVSCGGDQAVIAAENSTTGRRLERVFALEDLPDATAPRIVALAGLELLATLDPELRRSLAAADAPAASKPSAPRLRVFGGGVYRTFATAASGVQTWGAELGVNRSLGERFTVGGGVEAGRGGRTVNLGQMTALLGSASLAGGVRFGSGGLQASVALGARGGVARLAGKSSDTDVVAYAVTRPWAGPFVGTRASFGYRWLSFDVSLESGVTVIGASGLVNDLPALAARGVWLAGAVGAGVRL